MASCAVGDSRVVVLGIAGTGLTGVRPMRTSRTRLALGPRIHTGQAPVVARLAYAASVILSRGTGTEFR